MRSAGLRLVALTLLSAMGTLPQRAAAQDAKPGDAQTLTSTDGTESIQVPAAWKVESTTVHGADSAWYCLPPGGERCNLLMQRQLVSREEVLGTCASAWRKPRMKGAVFVPRPIPYVDFDVKGPNGAEW